MEKQKTTPKDFFIHLGIIITLYVSTLSLLNLLFETINAAFPDSLDYYVDPYSSTLRLAIASLIIVFPILLILSWISNGDIKINPAKADVGVKKWLTYLTLFLAGATIVTDLVVLINTFLGGEVTVRFGLKVMSVLVVIGIIFWYYLRDLKNISAGKYKKAGLLISIVLVVAAVILGFLVIGSPSSARAKRFDDTRLVDLQNLQQSVISYWQQKRALPQTLDDINSLLNYTVVPRDPETATAYEYRAISAYSFSVCATFDRDNTNDLNQANRYYNQSILRHASGRVCFDKTIDPQMYQPIK